MSACPYSTIAPVPPFTVKIPARRRMTSCAPLRRLRYRATSAPMRTFGEVQPLSLPVNFTPMYLGAWRSGSEIGGFDAKKTGVGMGLMR